MSKQIIQIEELIYKRMPKVSVQKWLAMLKEQFSVDESYGLLLDDYLLQEQTDNYYIDGHLVDSERIVYNINHSYHITRQHKPTISEEDTWEDSRLRFDASNHRYIVHNIHYLCEDLPHVTDQLCEADMPIYGKSTQAPPETKTTPISTPPSIKPQPKPVEQIKSVPKPAQKIPKTWDELAIGDRVKHTNYGYGVVAKFRTNNGNNFISIRYEFNIIKEYIYSEACINKFFTILAYR